MEMPKLWGFHMDPINHYSFGNYRAMNRIFEYEIKHGKFSHTIYSWTTSTGCMAK